MNTANLPPALQPYSFELGMTKIKWEKIEKLGAHVDSIAKESCNERIQQIAQNWAAISDLKAYITETNNQLQDILRAAENKRDAEQRAAKFSNARSSLGTNMKYYE